MMTPRGADPKIGFAQCSEGDGMQGTLRLGPMIAIIIYFGKDLLQFQKKKIIQLPQLRTASPPTSKK
jgi:hypothetical protein